MINGVKQTSDPIQQWIIVYAADNVKVMNEFNPNFLSQTFSQIAPLKSSISLTDIHNPDTESF